MERSLWSLNYVLKSRILTMWRKPGNSDIKSTRIYIWRRWIQSVNGWRHCGCESKLQIHQGTLFQVDIVNVSLMDELLARPLYACVCSIHGISQDAFDPWWKVPIRGQRMSWDILISVISGGLMAFGQNSTQLLGNPLWTLISLRSVRQQFPPRAAS